MSDFAPKEVEQGTRDFILHKTGHVPENVLVHAEGLGYVIEVMQGDHKLDEDTRERLQLILPENYRLELK